MRDILLPASLLKFLYFHPEFFQLGYFAAFVSLVLITYKIYSTRTKNDFRTRLLYVFYAGIFRAGLNAFLYHPYYTNLFSALLEIPQLLAVVNMAWFMLRRYGIGGTDE